VDQSYQRGAIINTALKKIEERFKPGKTMVVVPEGVMLNFWSKRENPTPITMFNPFFLDLFGEQRILESLRRNRPDYIVLVDRDFSEFGRRYFGQDFGISIYSWIKDNYQPIDLIGNPPMTGKGFGIVIAKRLPEAID
jgi:hypothetical protein